MSAITIDEFGPLPVRRPESVAELCGIVGEAAAAGQGVYPVGGRTTLDVGLPPSKPGLALDTTALNRVVDYPARDMTITVQAGITIAELQRTLAAEGQWLPIDVPNPERATLGGAIALNLSGPRRFGNGTFRDYVIGISFVTDEGQEVKAGGRVVKNVAGYDLMKLQVGAVGSLGVLTQVTLKVKPKPEAAAIVRMICTAARLGDVLDRLHESRSRPVIADAATDRSTLGAAWCVWAGYEEKAETVEWQVRTLLDEMRNSPVTDVTAERGPDAAARIASSGGSSCNFAFKANVRPSRTAEFLNAAAESHEIVLHSQALNGIVHGRAVTDVTLERAKSVAASLGDLAVAGGGNLAIVRCPTAWKSAFPVWGRPGPDRELMKHVKQTLDPKNVFNPGRLLG
ncbi:MAG: FAD-binding oxidoreductase [Gemmataceae bacterium]